MTTPLSHHQLDPRDPNWSATIDHLWQQLGAPHNPELLPPHFVKSTFPRMGGIVVTFHDHDRLVGVGLLFPRLLTPDGTRAYTLRLHEFDQHLPDDLLTAALHPTDVTIYRPRDGVTFAPPEPRPAGVWIGPPQAADLPAITALYRAVWNSQPYPTDLFSAECGPATALVATVDGHLAGFLLGFFRFGGNPAAPHELAIESQVMAVDPAYRNHGLATRLKRAQAHAALARGIRCIQWTVDPLQLPNALLNFNRLHAVAGAFVRVYYHVNNALNLVTASRF
ncbi:MAG: GNAT family N-acetyltransferase, partial [Chloroflexus sp.]